MFEKNIMWKLPLLKRLCIPQEVAETRLSFASDSASCITGEYITIGGY